jgi:hypothetical protein
MDVVQRPTARAFDVEDPFVFTDDPDEVSAFDAVVRMSSRGPAAAVEAAVVTSDPAAAIECAAVRPRDVLVLTRYSPTLIDEVIIVQRRCPNVVVCFSGVDLEGRTLAPISACALQDCYARPALPFHEHVDLFVERAEGCGGIVRGTALVDRGTSNRLVRETYALIAERGWKLQVRLLDVSTGCSSCGGRSHLIP